MGEFSFTFDERLGGVVNLEGRGRVGKNVLVKGFEVGCVGRITERGSFWGNKTWGID